MKKILGIVVLGLLLSGCQTPYGNEGLMGGYSDIKISDKSYRVSYAGNDYISFKKIRARAKLRAGEVALNNGFDYLAIGSSESYRRRGVTYTVTTYKYDQNIDFTDEGGNVCKVRGKGLSRVKAEEHVRNKIASCLGSNYLIATDVAKIYGYAR
tara:strand:- start:130 stop:591 length:462 start_codon:yes stop_codon:yes gene_type:complete